MYTNVIQIVRNKRDERPDHLVHTKKSGCFFVTGEPTRSDDRKLSISEKPTEYIIYRMPIVCGNNKDSLLAALKNYDEKRSLLVCFGGKESDFKLLKESLKEKSNWDCVILKYNYRYVLKLYWDFAGRTNYFCHSTILEEESFMPVKEEAKKEPPKKVEAPKKQEKKDADVSVQKPNIDTKTNK